MVNSKQPPLGGRELTGWPLVSSLRISSQYGLFGFRGGPSWPSRHRWATVGWPLWLSTDADSLTAPAEIVSDSKPRRYARTTTVAGQCSRFRRRVTRPIPRLPWMAITALSPSVVMVTGLVSGETTCSGAARWVVFAGLPVASAAHPGVPAITTRIPSVARGRDFGGFGRSEARAQLKRVVDRIKIDAKPPSRSGRRRGMESMRFLALPLTAREGERFGLV